MVRSCGPCQHNQHMNAKEPLTPRQWPVLLEQFLLFTRVRLLQQISTCAKAQQYSVKYILSSHIWNPCSKNMVFPAS
jgi:hypothetical protein